MKRVLAVVTLTVLMIAPAGAQQPDAFNALLFFLHGASVNADAHGRSLIGGPRWGSINSSQVYHSPFEQEDTGARTLVERWNVVAEDSPCEYKVSSRFRVNKAGEKILGDGAQVTIFLNKADWKSLNVQNWSPQTFCEEVPSSCGTIFGQGNAVGSYYVIRLRGPSIILDGTGNKLDELTVRFITNVVTPAELDRKMNVLAYIRTNFCKGAQAPF